ncbi:MAG: hypothetical protein ACYC9O_08545, partial [Candidatus Latescibacterota bacterium]
MKKFFSDLKISHRLLVGSAIFLLPVLVLYCFVLAGFNRDIRFARLEVQGLHLLRPFAVIVELLPVHRHYAHLYLLGNPAVQAQLKPVTDRIRGAFSDFFTESDALERPLRIDERGLQAARMEEILPSRIYRYWEKMHAEWNSIPVAEGDARHTFLIEASNSLFTRIGDNSNLILDPDLDSYYLMEIGVLSLPKCQEAVAEALLRGRDMLVSGNFAAGERAGVAAAADRIEHVYLDRLRKAVDTALREDPAFQGTSEPLQQNLPPVFAKYEQGVA